MTLSGFMDGPWKASHPAYDESWLNMRPAPEFATAEVVLASTYRAVGFLGHAESRVPAAGREFDKASAKKSRASPSKMPADGWKTILHGSLQSPKQPKQSTKRFLQLCPIVPDAALYSNSARLAGNSWNPGQLIERIVAMGFPDLAGGKQAWRFLFDALGVHEDDDVWARWLQGEFERRRTLSVQWRHSPLEAKPVFTADQLQRLHIPARQFVADLQAVVEAKGCMTRRQWVSILEAVLRVGSVSHVLWLCGVNARYSKAIIGVLNGSAPLNTSELELDVVRAPEKPLIFGVPAQPIIQDLSSRYLSARLLINLVLWRLDALGVKLAPPHSVSDAARLLELVATNRDRLEPTSLLRDFDAMSDRYARDIGCKRGIGSNIVEFARHALGQRQTADPTLRGYDQGYSLKKRAAYRAAPWVVALGPVALLAFAHCCLAEAAGPRSVGWLREHLGKYGFDIAQDDLIGNELGHELRTLGLVLDSPDAESGMLLVPPFEIHRPGVLR